MHNHVVHESCVFTFIGLHTVVGITMSNTWLLNFIIVCATALRMYIWYDDKIHFICTGTCLRSTYLLITNIVCIIILMLLVHICTHSHVIHKSCSLLVKHSLSFTST